MSTLDEYEHRRGPVRQRRKYNRRRAPGARANPREVQIALKLLGGCTAKEKAADFDDPIPPLAR